MKNLALLILGTLSFVSCSHSKKNSQVATTAIESVKIKHDFKIDTNYNPAERDKNIDAYFQRLHARMNFNGAVLIAKKGKIVYRNVFGYANYAKRLPILKDSHFQLASISKQFTSFAAMMLKDQGKLKFEQNVTDFFPDFPYPGISIRMLMTHRSGLPNYQYYSEGVWKDKHKAMSNMDLMTMLAKNKPGRWSAPDTHFLYNNINYAVLAAIIEKVSGKSLSLYMKQNVFDQIGMTHTHIYSKVTDTLAPTNLIGYERSFRRGDYPNWLDGVVGDKGVYTTVGDMFIWDQMLYTDRLLKPATLQEAFVGYSKEMKGHFNYGYGWRIFDVDPGQKIVYHTGWWHGYKNIFVRDIRHETTVVILSNMFNSSINDLDDLYAMLNIPPIRMSAY